MQLKVKGERHDVRLKLDSDKNWSWMSTCDSNSTSFSSSYVLPRPPVLPVTKLLPDPILPNVVIDVGTVEPSRYIFHKMRCYRRVLGRVLLLT